MVIPCVYYHIEEKDLYEIVDSYHRYMVMKTSQRIYDREKGLLPVVEIKKDKCYCNTMERQRYTKIRKMINKIIKTKILKKTIKK